ncbi:MAG: hypothetical protein HY865_18890 [Chloroflexi bacterium]|nr:hypothetical protein [Chloroflexota bacterium]
MNSSPTTTSRRESFLAILLVVFTTLITYGTQIQQLGFYRDDWYLLWGAQSKGVEGILSMFQGDRPFVGWLYVFDFSVMGLSPLNWHVYVLCIKLASALAFLWLVRSVWSQRKIETLFITLLFVVYPGFYQQPNALTYKQLLLSYTASLLSLALTVNAVKAEKITAKSLLTILAVALGVFYILIYEALVGMEVVRLLLLWMVFSQQGKNWKENIRLSLTNAIPYLLFAASFVYWRIFLFESTRKATSVEGLVGNFTSLHGLIGLLIETAKDLVETSILAWAVPFYQFSNEVDYRDFGVSLALGFLVVLAGAGYYFLARRQDETEAESSRDFLILGAVIVFVTTLPIIAAGRNVHFSGWDRYTYQSVFGVALFMGGVVFYLIKSRARWILLAALLVSGVSTQFASASYFRDFWKIEREAWWQLSWRAPQIADGTTVVTAMPSGYGLAEEYEVWGPVNLIYQPGGPLRLPGQIAFDQIWVDLLLRTQEKRLVRDTFTIPRDYGRVIIVSQPSPNACLHVLDGRRFDQAITEARTDVRLIAQYSDVSLIEASGQQSIPPVEVFGSEPSHGWCYFYQKMDLARQTEDWNQVVELGDQAWDLDLRPAEVSEWFPLLEAYVNLGDIENAKAVARLIRDDKNSFTKLCTQYESTKKQPAEYDRIPVYEALCWK